MIEWQYRKIKDFAKLSQGLAINAKTNHLLVEKSDTPLLRIKDLLNNQYEQFVDVEKVPKQCIAYPEDLIMTRTGQVGHVFMDKYGVVHNNSFKIIVDNNQVNTRFLYWHFNSKSQRDYLTSISAGSVQPDLNHKNFNEYEVFLPPLSEQQAIASVLSSLDDKIDLLHRQNKTLEAMAETLFRQWFIEEAKDDWEFGTFEKWISETKGGDWGKENPQDDFNKAVMCIRGTDIADLQKGLPKSTPIRFIKAKKFDSIEPQNGDIVFEISGGTETQSTGRSYFVNESVKKLFDYPIVFSNFCRLLKVRNSKFSLFVFLYLQYLYKNDEFFSLENGSSGIKNLNYKVLLFEQLYKMPPIELVLEFNNEVSCLFEKINSNKFQISTLENLRDTLLPKLMSGEIRVQH